MEKEIKCFSDGCVSCGCCSCLYARWPNL